MRFSIITPVYNGMPFLKEAVASVQQQRADAGVDVEHIILDPGSTDGSREWLRENASDAALVFEKDRGQTDALIKGFAAAQGEVLGWLNADDTLEPHALLRVKHALLAHPEAVGATGACLIMDQEGRIDGAFPVLRSPAFHDVLNTDLIYPQPATFFRRSAFDAVGGLNARFDLCMDLDLFLRLSRHGAFSILQREVLARFRVHPGAKSSRYRQAMAREDLRVRLSHGLSRRSGAARILFQHAYLPRGLDRILAATYDAAYAAVRSRKP